MEKLSLEKQDIEWKRDWQTITQIFEKIEELQGLYENLDVPYLREVQQRILILNLEKYAWSLQNFIIERYSRE